MTYEELCFKLLITNETDIYETLTKWQSAIYAVIELHVQGKGEASRCESCYLGFDCPTIAAIEKELS